MVACEEQWHRSEWVANCVSFNPGGNRTPGRVGNHCKRFPFESSVFARHHQPPNEIVNAFRIVGAVWKWIDDDYMNALLKAGDHFVSKISERLLGVAIGRRYNLDHCNDAVTGGVSNGNGSLSFQVA